MEVMQEHRSQAIHAPASQANSVHAFNEERHNPFTFLNLNVKAFNIVRLLEPKGHAYTQALDVDSL
jgi:hypothetical protein